MSEKFFFTKIWNYIFKQLLLIQKNLFEFLLTIFLGIFCGGIFGTFLPFFRKFITWDILIISILLLISEVLSLLIYKKKKPFLLSIDILQYINWLKIGILLGFFIDAFKVGS